MWKPESGSTANPSKKEGPKSKGYDLFSEENNAFRKLGEKLEDDLRLFKVDANIYDHDVIAKIEASGLPQSTIDKFKSLFTQRAEMALEDDLNPLEACRLLPQLGMEDRLRERVKRGIRYGETPEGEVCFDYFSKGFKYMDEEERVKYTDEFLTENDFTALEGTEYFREERKAFDAAFEKYCAKWNLPHVSLGLEQVYAAQEIMKAGYDMAVGVNHSGASMAVLLESLGMPARYVEWHAQDWEGPPVLQEMGQAKGPSKGPKKILLTENSAYSLATLEAVIPTLQELGAGAGVGRVDTMFLYDPLKQNQKAMRNLPFYGKTLQADGYQKKAVYEKLRGAKKRIEAAVAEGADASK